VLEVHPVDRGDQRGRQEGGPGHGQELDDVVLLVADEAQRRLHHEGHVAGLEGGLVQQELDVPGDLGQPRLRWGSLLICGAKPA
jgi:hypothetical protein